MYKTALGLRVCRFRCINHIVCMNLRSFLQALFPLFSDSTFPFFNTLRKSTPLHHNYTISLQNQILQWNTYARPILNLDPAKTLVAIWIGINDIGDTDKYTFPSYNATDFPSLYKDIIETEFKSVETIYEAGFRDFLFMNLPPLQRTVWYSSHSFKFHSHSFSHSQFLFTLLPSSSFNSLILHLNINHKP